MNDKKREVKKRKEIGEKKWFSTEWKEKKDIKERFKKLEKRKIRQGRIYEREEGIQDLM